jgi:hypothetical protein
MTILNRPMSPLRATWVPPHSSQEAHFVAVLFAEQHHGAGLLRLLDRHHARAGRRVCDDFVIDDALDASDFFRRDRLRMGEVEAGLVGIDLRTLLLHVRAEHFAQRLVHQVRRRMVAHRAGARRGIDFRRDAAADFQCSGAHHAVVAEDAGLDLLRVFHGEDAVAGTQFADIADLAAGFGIEGRVV